MCKDVCVSASTHIPALLRLSSQGHLEFGLTSRCCCSLSNYEMVAVNIYKRLSKLIIVGCLIWKR